MLGLTGDEGCDLQLNLYQQLAQIFNLGMQDRLMPLEDGGQHS